MTIEIGRAAPAFTLHSTDGKKVSLKDFLGKKVVLYFYPADDTPACTTEACGFRDSLPAFEEAGAVVLGVSPDDVATHEKFRSKYRLPFALLADEGHKMSERYGIWKEKLNYGRKYMGIERTTLVIDTRGKIAAIFRRVRVAGHDAKVLAAVQAAG